MPATSESIHIGAQLTKVAERRYREGQRLRWVISAVPNWDCAIITYPAENPAGVR